MHKWKTPSKTSSAIYGAAAFVTSILVAGIARLKIKNDDPEQATRKLPDGPLIIVSNHTSLADGILLALVCRRRGRTVRMLSAAGVFKIPVIGWLMRRARFVPVYRNGDNPAGALDAAITALNSGEAVGLYPEGRITRDADYWPEKSKTGAVRMAVATGAPILPIAMVGAPKVVGRKYRFTKLAWNVLRRPKVHVRVGDPIDVVAMTGTEPSQEDIRHSADVVMVKLVAMVSAMREDNPVHLSGVPTKK